MIGEDRGSGWRRIDRAKESERGRDRRRETWQGSGEERREVVARAQCVTGAEVRELARGKG